MDEDEKVQQIQGRIQQLYDIPLPDFTSENGEELNVLTDQMETMGYERAEDDSIDNIRYVKQKG